MLRFHARYYKKLRNYYKWVFKYKNSSDLSVQDLGTINYRTPPNSPGDIIRENYEVEDSSIFGVVKRNIADRFTVIDTDYVSYAVVYECYESKVNDIPKVNQKAFITARNRSFDSFTQFKGAIAQLKALGVSLDDLRFYNSPNYNKLMPN